MKYEKISYRVWKVHTDNDKEYTVALNHRGWHCDCFYFSVKKRYCTHIKLVKEGEGLE